MNNLLKFNCFIIISILLISCDEQTETTTISGTSTLSSLPLDGKRLGFSFEQRGVIFRDDKNIDDFVLAPMLTSSGDPIGSMLITFKDTKFAMLSKDLEITSDPAYFESIKFVPDSIDYWKDLTNIWNGQILFIQTSDKHFAKIHLRDVRH